MQTAACKEITNTGRGKKKKEKKKPIKSRDAKTLDAELVACDVIGHLTMIMALN